MSNVKLVNGHVGAVLKCKFVDENGAAIDVSGATEASLDIVIKGRTGSAKVNTASFFTDGTDGFISYTTQSGDIDETGTWQIWPRYVDGDEDFYGPPDTFEVVAAPV